MVLILMNLTSKQQADIRLCKYFYPCEPTEEEIYEYLALSERGEGAERGKFSQNPLVIGKTKRGLHMQLWEEGILEGTIPYFVLLCGIDNNPLPRIVVDFMKKEMFKGIDAQQIEDCYQKIQYDPHTSTESDS